jgi:hypothetical protein
VNGDTKADLICANYDDDTLTVLTNSGAGLFALYALPGVGNGPSAVRAADVDGNGNPDLICANILASTVSVLTNSGSNFIAGFSAVVGAGPSTIVVADLNADSKVDLVSANSGGHSVSVLMNVPVLKISKLGSNAMVSWPASWTNWVLQQKSNLNSGSWLNTGAITNNGTNKSVTVPAGSGNLFFRLSNP